jgi:NDP-sugar pyrophosphorylase family protein
MTGMPPIAVLAGGLATRMRPLTAQLPKALLKVAGEPFIAHQLRLFAREGIKGVKILVGYRWEQIELFVADGSRFGVRVDYIVDGPTLLGTGGSVRHALDHLGSNFLVIYCDSWLDSQYAPVVEAFHAAAFPLSCVCSATRTAGTRVTSNSRTASSGVTPRSPSGLRCITLIGAWHVRCERGGGVADG